MKIKILFFLLLSSPALLHSQETSAPTDSAKALFKSPVYSYINWDFGYSVLNIKNNPHNAFDLSIIGIVFNEKWHLSFGMTGFAKDLKNVFPEESFPVIDSYIMAYLNNEFLLKPRKLINFSFPLRIGYCGATAWDTMFSYSSTQSVLNWKFTGKNYYQHDGAFWTIAPGANVFINLFKGMSLGVGANYRFALDVPKELGTESDMSGYSILAFLRIKYDTRAIIKRTMLRQQEYLKWSQGQ